MTTPYAELHCHSNFSFLDGASHPEELVSEAARLGLDALALTDHDGLYGVVRFAETARALGLPSIFGAELTLVEGGRSGARTGAPDPPGTHLVVLARDPEGYARLSRAITEAHLAGGEKGRPTCTLEDLARHHGGNGHGGHWVVLTGCRKGAVAAALTAAGPARGHPRARPARRGLRSRRRGRGALGPRRPARHRPQRRPGPSRRHPGPGHGGHQQRPLRHPGPAAAGHHPGRGAGPAAARRARRLAPLRRHRPPPLGGRAGASLRPVARRGGPGRRDRSGVRLRPPPGGPRPPRLPGARRAHRAQLAGGAGGPRGRRPLRPARGTSACPARGPRSTTSSR